MATPDEYAAVQHVILRDLDNFIMRFVPDYFGYRDQALKAMPQVAQTCGKDAVDILDAFRAKEQKK